jgi:hypothetical protein
VVTSSTPQYVPHLPTQSAEDDDVERKTQAEVLLNAYSRELERRRLAAGAQGLLISGQGKTHGILFNGSTLLLFSDDDSIEDDGDSSDEEFHYPGAPTFDSARTPSRQSSVADYFNRPLLSRVPTDLTPQLSQAPEFRVPTHETPQKVLTPRWTPPTPHQVQAQWERDEAALECRHCQRRFGFLFRRVSLSSFEIISCF